jgi:hypothetical protein
MYLTPSAYQCPKGHEFPWSPHDQHPAPIWQHLNAAGRPWDDKARPVCPKCWSDFLVKSGMVASPLPVPKA